MLRDKFISTFRISFWLSVLALPVLPSMAQNVIDSETSLYQGSWYVRASRPTLQMGLRTNETKMLTGPLDTVGLNLDASLVPRYGEVGKCEDYGLPSLGFRILSEDIFDFNPHVQEWWRVQFSTFQYDEYGRMIHHTGGPCNSTTGSCSYGGRTTYEWAEDNVLQVETRESWDDDSFTWNGYFRLVTLRDETEHPRGELQQSRLESTGQWLNVVRKVDYPNSISPQSSLVQYWDSNSSTWHDEWRNQYTYSEDGRLQQSKHFEWDGFTWTLTSTWLNTYSDGHTERIGQRWDSDTSQSVSSTKDEQFFNSFGCLTESRNSTWDETLVSWIYGGRRVFEYQEEYILTEWSTSNWDSIHWEWAPNQLGEPEYDDNGNRVTEIVNWLNPESGVTDSPTKFERIFEPVPTARERFLVDEYVVKLDAYPNPFSDQLTVDFSLSTQQDVTIEFVDLLGRTVCEHQVLSAQIGMTRATIDSSALRPGVYLLRLIGSEMVASRVVFHAH